MTIRNRAIDLCSGPSKKTKMDYDYSECESSDSLNTETERKSRKGGADFESSDSDTPKKKLKNKFRQQRFRHSRDQYCSKEMQRMSGAFRPLFLYKIMFSPYLSRRSSDSCIFYFPFGPVIFGENNTEFCVRKCAANEPKTRPKFDT